jgi:hypothetical protein
MYTTPQECLRYVDVTTDSHLILSPVFQQSNNGKYVRVTLTVCLVCQTFIDPPKDGAQIIRDNITCKITYCSVGEYKGRMDLNIDTTLAPDSSVLNKIYTPHPHSPLTLFLVRSTLILSFHLYISPCKGLKCWQSFT